MSSSATRQCHRVKLRTIFVWKITPSTRSNHYHNQLFWRCCNNPLKTGSERGRQRLETTTFHLIPRSFHTTTRLKWEGVPGKKSEEYQANKTVSEVVYESIKLATDAVRKAREIVNLCDDDVIHYAAKIKEFEMRTDFSGFETQYIALKERRDKTNERLKEANERFKEVNEFYLKLIQANPPVEVVNEDVLEATAKATSFVKALMKEDALEDVPNGGGMKLMRDIPDLLTNEKLKTLVIREIADKFWQTCFDTAEKKGFQVCAVGTPGIGKTTTTPYLIHLILKRGNTVIYVIRSPEKSNWYYKFTPTGDNDIDVVVYPEKMPAFEIPSLKDPSVYYIVDPGRTKDNCVPDSWFRGKFILVSSPYEGHWGGSEFLKGRYERSGVFLYLPIWKLEELLVASNFIDSALTSEQICERYRQFGGILRSVFEREAMIFKARLTDQDYAMDSVSAERAESMCFSRVNIFGSFGFDTKNALMAFELSNDDDFQSGVPVIISPRVFDTICMKYMKNLWHLVFTDEVRGKILFESYTRLLMVQSSKIRFSRRPCVGRGKNQPYDEISHVWLGGCSSIRVAEDIVYSAKKCPGVLFHLTRENQKLIDFIYQDDERVFHAFQVTVGKSHHSNAYHINELEKEIKDAKNKLRVYYLVPEAKFATFVTTPVKPDVTCRVYHVKVRKPGLEGETNFQHWNERILSILRKIPGHTLLLRDSHEKVD